MSLSLPPFCSIKGVKEMGNDLQSNRAVMPLSNGLSIGIKEQRIKNHEKYILKVNLCSPPPSVTRGFKAGALKTFPQTCCNSKIICNTT